MLELEASLGLLSLCHCLDASIPLPMLPSLPDSSPTLVSALTPLSPSLRSSSSPPARPYLPPSSSGSWDEIKPHFVYSQLGAGRRQLLQGEFLALFSTPVGNSPEPGAMVAYGVPMDVSYVGEGVRDGSGSGGI